MSLGTVLAQKKSNIIKKWISLIVGSYPEDSRRFLKKEKSQFANPVGQTIRNEVEILYDELFKDSADTNGIAASLDRIIRIRAVQDFRPSQAIAFVLQLKRLIREEVEGKALLDGVADELHTLDDRIDKMALLAFDIYSSCRQKIYEIRVNEVKRQVGRLLERANLVCEIPDVGEGL